VVTLDGYCLANDPNVSAATKLESLNMLAKVWEFGRSAGRMYRGRDCRRISRVKAVDRFQGADPVRNRISRVKAV